MSTHPKQEKLENSLRLLCDDLDTFLEDRFGSRFKRHPNRLERGKAASVAYDGLFSTGTQFTLGYGSIYGRGYVISIEVRTLEKVPSDSMAEIEEAAIEHLKTRIPARFPDRKISVVKDGEVYKLIGDFSLGSV
ncbi:hypothetical protein SpiGrapes_2762 [Sphaerochaeta pleomorpha str. Grapes]|uniref:Uncharacterized protein n=1 Tax=Sphaerochaeta pleomorpha (strain ATCC BAA-1885 / DSM 22778 / Grapes) TaxID=158190 RepID=G8QVZ5_SPHPG|nr:hypothetical protein [Sphaerochaeta pleomorpha]AEV30519.1 hypothetical protein SpiGrapes_2762 [Sphaerochaeta pleomorpha str. Grapes]